MAFPYWNWRLNLKLPSDSWSVPQCSRLPDAPCEVPFHAVPLVCVANSTGQKWPCYHFWKSFHYEGSREPCYEKHYGGDQMKGNQYPVRNWYASFQMDPPVKPQGQEAWARATH